MNPVLLFSLSLDFTKCVIEVSRESPREGTGDLAHMPETIRD